MVNNNNKTDDMVVAFPLALKCRSSILRFYKPAAV